MLNSLLSTSNTTLNNPSNKSPHKPFNKLSNTSGNKPANRHQICFYISIAMMTVMLAQSLKLLVLGDAQNAFLHWLNLSMHFILFAVVPLYLKKNAFLKARNLLIISFNSYLTVACSLWQYDLGVQNYFLLALFISIYLIGSDEIWQLFIVLGFELLAFVGFSFILLKLDNLLILQSQQALSVIEDTNILTFAFSCCICALFVRHLLSKNWQTLRHYKIQQSQLLEHMLPKDIADALLMGNSPQCCNYEFEDTSLYRRKKMAVLFMDICGFTESLIDNEDKSRKSTYSLFAQINRMCKSFDAKRIKTNGDQYILVIGMQSPDLPAFDICEQAILLGEQITTHCRQQHKVSIRIGIAFGEVVVGVFDINNPSFDIWGETVVRASRLEIQARPNEILVDEYIHHCLKEQHRFGQESQLFLKGIGSAKVYSLAV